MSERIRDLLKKLFKTGFFSIYIATIGSKVITLLGGVLIVRILSQEDYGIYTLVLNAISMLCIFGDFGASGATLQYGIESEKDLKKQSGFFKLGLRMIIFASLASFALIILSPLYYPYQNETIGKLTFMMAGIAIFTNLVNYIGMILRVKKKNNLYSAYQILTTIIHYTVVIVLTILFGLKGSLFSQYIYNIIIFIIGCFFIRKHFKIKESKKIEASEKKGFWKMGISSQLNNTLNSLLYQIDIFILGIMVTNTVDISIYKVATIIPNALAFLPQCLAIYANPYFISHNKDPKWINNNVKKMIKYMTPIYLIITICLILGSKLIINILYGEEYIAAIYPFTILMIGFFFTATIKSLLTNLIYCLHKIWFSVILNIVSMIINAILDVIFIFLFGYIGVALATLIINILSSVIAVIYYKKCIRELNGENITIKRTLNDKS